MTTRKPREDRRVSRTRRLLRDAVISLILERGWDAVSVQSVCERADVGRSTFYTHFIDKEDLLMSGFGDLRSALKATRVQSSEPFAMVRGLLEHVNEHQRLARAMLGKRSGQLVQRNFRKMVLGVMDDEVPALKASPVPRDAVVQFLSGSLIELVTWWLEGHSSLGPDEIDTMFRRLATPVLRAV